MKPATLKHLETLLDRFPQLSEVASEIQNAVAIVVNCHNRGGKVLVCGNGGSAADSEHIVGELMKGFLLKRRIPSADSAKLADIAAEDLVPLLQTGIKAISLTGHVSLSTAVLNDNDPLMGFAQQAYVYGDPGDVVIGLSTSGNAKNVVNAFKVAKAFGLLTIAFTGRKPSALDSLSDVAIKVPEEETYRVQELHLPGYHALCAMSEEEIFGEN